jgi:hypothetical protein
MWEMIVNTTQVSDVAPGTLVKYDWENKKNSLPTEPIS